MSRKLILDLDTGIDDALAIAYALGSPEAELIGITATYGNVLMERSVRNSLAVLDILGASSVPVHPGLPHSSTTEDFSVQEISAFIHGRNGVGEVDIAPSPRSAEATGAVDFIIEASHRYGDELVYIPTGPLTNLAAALEKDPGLADRLKVVLMGGALSVSGNVSPWAEANISQDPDAADAVLRSGIDATMIGLDVTLQTLLTREQTRRWRELGTPAGAFLADMTDYYIKAYETTAPGLGGCGLHDPLAVGVAIDPTLVTAFPVNLQVDVEGPTRGRTIGDVTRLNDPRKTSRAALDVDVDRFLEEFMSRIPARPRPRPPGGAAPPGGGGGPRAPPRAAPPASAWLGATRRRSLHLDSVRRGEPFRARVTLLRESDGGVVGLAPKSPTRDSGGRVRRRRTDLGAELNRSRRRGGGESGAVQERAGRRLPVGTQSKLRL